MVPILVADSWIQFHIVNMAYGTISSSEFSEAPGSRLELPVLVHTAKNTYMILHNK